MYWIVTFFVRFHVTVSSFQPAYFGVKLKREGGYFWMENDDTIRQVCGKKWIEVVKVLDFKIRFFPPDLTRISDDNIM